jgi:hypothetical protein
MTPQVPQGIAQQAMPQLYSAVLTWPMVPAPGNMIALPAPPQAQGHNSQASGNSR